MAALFAEDAVFQGLPPYSAGRQGVAEYSVGCLDVDFTFTDRPRRAVRLAVVVTRAGDDWHISHCQVSRLDQGLRRV
ncbi:hypothetical protein [Streptomyces sviceus]|uniref:hypothetical protein n=1 Tax=Streptomyces sviceus TaxID=285530 RepID=UPI00331A116C